MAEVAEADRLDGTHFETLLDAKIDPLIKTVDRLERQQERIVGLMEQQATIAANVKNLEGHVGRVVEDNARAHDALFLQIRNNEVAIDTCKHDSGSKVWDVLKLVIAGTFGGIVAILSWLAGKQ